MNSGNFEAQTGKEPTQEEAWAIQASPCGSVVRPRGEHSPLFALVPSDSVPADFRTAPCYFHLGDGAGTLLSPSVLVVSDNHWQ